ncbi:MAG: hypothetical protein WEA09_07240 [Gemmatimonadota bacterium]
MSLRDLLYRCPVCGHHPLKGVGDEVGCAECGVVYHRGGAPALIRIIPGSGSDGGPVDVPASVLSRALEEWGGALSTVSQDPESGLKAEADVRLKRGRGESVLHSRGQFLGFRERMADTETGRLILDPDKLCFQPSSGNSDVVWALRDVRGVQIASSALQLYLASRLLLHFRFVDDSCRRWDELLRHAIQEVWRDEGWGEIVEFQPRISVR